jgi:hypothetical protein
MCRMLPEKNEYCKKNRMNAQARRSCRAKAHRPCQSYGSYTSNPATFRLLRKFLQQPQQLAVELVALEVLVLDIGPAGIEDAE